MKAKNTIEQKLGSCVKNPVGLLKQNRISIDVDKKRALREANEANGANKEKKSKGLFQNVLKRGSRKSLKERTGPDGSMKPRVGQSSRNPNSMLAPK